MKTNFNPSLKKELMTLIVADMRSRKLVMGLDAAGLSTDDFNTNLSDLIFEKLGVAKQHKTRIGNWYEETIYTILDIDVDIFREHQLFLAITFYDSLQEEVGKLQTNQLLKPKRKLTIEHASQFSRFDN